MNGMVTVLASCIAEHLPGQLGVQGEPATFHYSDLYGFIVCVIVLAIVNGMVGVAAGAWITFRGDQERVYRIGRFIMLSLVTAQALLGLAPCILLVKALYKADEAGVAYYGMPIFQILLVVFFLGVQRMLLTNFKRAYGHEAQSRSRAT